MRFLSSCVSILVFASVAQADEAEIELRQEFSCFPADGIIELLNKFDELPEKRKDTVSAKFAAMFEITDDGALPDRFFMRDGDIETDFKMMTDGSIPDFLSLKSAADTSEICVQDKARAGLPREQDGIEFDLNMDIAFHNTSGVHSVEELRDGANDGRRYYKKMIGGIMSNMVPKFEYVTLSYDDETISPDTIAAYREGEKLDGLTIEPFGKTFVISIDELEDMKADELRISGGPYKLEPTPSIKTMKKFGFSEKPEDGEDSED